MPSIDSGYRSRDKSLGENFKMRRKEFIFYPLLTMMLYSILGFYVLMNGHLHEDAYILYIFSESFASGNGVAYFPDGPPAEGATDFLWMIFLGIGKFFGVDVAIMATILNGFGLSVITFFGLMLASRRIANTWLNLFGFSLAIILSLSQISQASLAGFSAGFYSAFVVALFYLIYDRKKELLYLIPLLGIILGLLRPDGVIIGVFASIIGFYFSFKNSVEKKYLATASISLVIGIVYFIWRYDYFGNLLPLPLYVKATTPESLPGLLPHVNWALHNGFLGVVAILTLLLCKQRWQILLASIPVGMLFLALIFATQSQNVAYRFQAPGTAILLMWASILISKLPEILIKLPVRKKIATITLFVLVVGSATLHARGTSKIISYLTSDQYINFFPYHLASSFNKDTVIALTEAGRFAYWVTGEKYDLVGLNTPKVAIQNASPQYIRSLDPDVIFMHTADTANFSEFCDEVFCTITESDFLQNVTSKDHWDSVKYGVKRAPLTVYEYVEESKKEFTIYIVKYKSYYSHVYLLRLNGDIDRDSFEKALELSRTDSGGLSYWDMKVSREWSSIFDEG